MRTIFKLEISAFFYGRRSLVITDSETDNVIIHLQPFAIVPKGEKTKWKYTISQTDRERILSLIRENGVIYIRSDDLEQPDKEIYDGQSEDFYFCDLSKRNRLSAVNFFISYSSFSDKPNASAINSTVCSIMTILSGYGISFSL